MIRQRSVWTPALLLGLLAGCSGGENVDPHHVAAHRDRYLLAVEPDGAIGVAEAKTAVAENEQVVLIGRIQGGELGPWSDGRAAFLLADAAASIDVVEDDHHHAPGHDHANCPFCKRNKGLAEAQAIVQFLGDDGRVLPIDSRKLLPLEEGQLVVVRGKGKVDDLGTLVIAAEGIYLRR